MDQLAFNLISVVSGFSVLSIFFLNKATTMVIVVIISLILSALALSPDMGLLASAAILTLLSDYPYQTLSFGVGLIIRGLLAVRR